MVEFVGQSTRRAICTKCRTQIHWTEWDGLPDSWSHDQNGLLQCPGSPTADPDPASIEELNRYGHVLTPCKCPEGPYEGARGANVPRFCERCRHIVPTDFREPMVGFVAHIHSGEAMPTPEQIEESRRRNQIPDDWDLVPCQAECGDWVWLSPGMKDAVDQTQVGVAVCSSACAMKLIEILND